MNMMRLPRRLALRNDKGGFDESNPYT